MYVYIPEKNCARVLVSTPTELAPGCTTIAESNQIVQLSTIDLSRRMSGSQSLPLCINLLWKVQEM